MPPSGEVQAVPERSQRAEDFRQEAQGPRIELLRSWHFLKRDMKWRLTPILVAILLIGGFCWCLAGWCWPPYNAHCLEGMSRLAP